MIILSKRAPQSICIQKGLETTLACSARDFYRIFNSDVALAIINTERADQSGFALVRFISSNVKIRIIVVSEKSSCTNRAEGYGCGAIFFCQSRSIVWGLG